MGERTDPCVGVSKRLCGYGASWTWGRKGCGCRRHGNRVVEESGYNVAPVWRMREYEKGIARRERVNTEGYCERGRIRCGEGRGWIQKGYSL